MEVRIRLFCGEDGLERTPGLEQFSDAASSRLRKEKAIATRGWGICAGQKRRGTDLRLLR